MRSWASVMTVLALLNVGVAADAATFRQGENGYSDAIDTFFQNNLGTSGASSDLLTVQRGDNTFSTKNALLRFNNIIGDGAGQIPAGSIVLSATLTVRTSANDGDQSSSPVNLHRMLADWDESDSEDTFGSGNPPRNNQDWVQADGSEAAIAVTDSITPSTLSTFFDFNVTADVQAWVAGQNNLGWVMLADAAANEVDVSRFHSAEATTLGHRPLLTVQFVPEPSTLALVMAGGFAFMLRRHG